MIRYYLCWRRIDWPRSFSACKRGAPSPRRYDISPLKCRRARALYHDIPKMSMTPPASAIFSYGLTLHTSFKFHFHRQISAFRRSCSYGGRVIYNYSSIDDTALLFAKIHFGRSLIDTAVGCGLDDVFSCFIIAIGFSMMLDDYFGMQDKHAASHFSTSREASSPPTEEMFLWRRS